MKPVDITTTSHPEGVGVGVLLEESTWPKWSSIAIKKKSYKKGIATDPIPATSRLTWQLTFGSKKLSVELTFAN